MTKIDFYGGVDEIGGNKIEIKSDNSGFFFDFGWLLGRPMII